METQCVHWVINDVPCTRQTVCMRVCEREGEGEREREQMKMSESMRDRERERELKRWWMCVCVCVLCVECIQNYWASHRRGNEELQRLITCILSGLAEMNWGLSHPGSTILYNGGATKRMSLNYIPTKCTCSMSTLLNLNFWFKNGIKHSY